MSLSLFEIYGLVCAFLLGAVGIWRLTEAICTEEREGFELIYSSLIILGSLVSGAGFMVGRQGFYYVPLLVVLIVLGTVFTRVRAEADSFRDQYRKLLELGVALVTWANLAIEFTQANDQWWISLVVLLFPLWALHSLITRADSEQAAFQADSKKRDGEALDHTGQEPDTDTV